MGLYLNDFRNSETYKVYFFHPKAPSVVGWLSAPIQITTESMWANAAEQKFGSAFNSIMQAAASQSTVLGAFTYQAWQGIDTIIVTFELKYVAVADAFSEVVSPVRDLMKYPLPPVFTHAMLEPPVDSITDDTCCVVEGAWFVIAELLPRSCMPQFGHTFSKSGHPTSAQVSMTFQTRRAMSMADVQQWFK